MTYTSEGEVNQTGKTRDKAWRRQQLKRLWWMLEDHKDDICKALYTDLHKHAFESLTEVGGLQHDILHTLKNLDAWTADQRPAKYDGLNFMGRTTVRMEPLGTALIVGAWNFPFLLLLQPVIAAIAAGCTAVLKPSDVALASQDLIHDLVTKYLDQDAIVCMTAGPSEMGYILQQKFDIIFYTGSPGVAKIVSAAAAKHLTPVVLELGGQGPAIVCKSADIELAAKRVAAMKFMNAGQICLNVNHVFVDPSVLDQFTAAVGRYFQKFSGGASQDTDYYTHLISDRSFDRLTRLLGETKGQVVYGGDTDRSSRYFGPTVVKNVTKADSLMSEELFGPILPVISADLDTAIKTINELDHPLCLYPFTTDSAEKAKILATTTSGGVTFNDCAVHAAAPDAPFGGVGNSGSGYYHGPHGVRSFSYLRTYVDLPNWMDVVMGFRYPPYTMKNAATAAQYQAPWFDREGKDVASWGVLKTAMLGSAVLGSVWYYMQRRS